MAIIVPLGVEVCICINGQPLEEYDDAKPSTGEDEEYDICSKYVESVDDAEYTLIYKCFPDQRWLYDSPENRLIFRLYVDGKEACAHTVNRGLILYKDGSISVEGAETFQGHGKPIKLSKFKFSAVMPVEDADLETIHADTERAASLGEVRVDVWRVIAKPTNDSVSHEAIENAPAENDLSIAEKALSGKAISHGTLLAAPVDAQVEYIYGLGEVDDFPLASFRFKYRSKEGLRQELVVPRTPRSPMDLRSPTPRSDNYPMLAALPQEDLLRLASERLVQIKKENETVVKREFGDTELRADNALSVRPLNIRRRDDGKHEIDLTDD